MQKNSRIYNVVILALLATFGIQSCSMPDLIVPEKNAPKEYRAYKGDSVEIRWNYLNADRVYIDGYVGMYNTSDYIRVYADKSKDIVIRAYQGNVDSLIERRSIIVGQVTDEIADTNDATETPAEESQYIAPTPNVTEPENISSPQRGPLREEVFYGEVRTGQSEYFRGVKRDGGFNPTTLRVTRVTPEATANGYKLYMRALLLDEHGNFVAREPDNTNYHFNLDYGYNDKKVSHVTDKVYELVSDDGRGCDYTFLVDNSLAATENDKIMQAVREFAGRLSQQDRMSLAGFNSGTEKMFDMMSPEYAISELRSLSMPKSRGLNALYKVAYKSAKDAKSTHNEQAIVIVTHYNDNASIIYSANDLIKIANQKQIPVYIVAVGDALKTYFLNYICNRTGGKFYHVFSDETDKINDILAEIAFGIKNYYLIEFPNISAHESVADQLRGTLKLNVSNTQLADAVDIFPQPIAEYFQYQALSLFDFRSIELLPEYRALLDSFAVVLLDNPQYNVALIGHTSDEGSPEYMFALSLDRANAVKDYLIAAGVPAKQITVKSFGYRKPLYFGMMMEPWQERMNRRVEVRWLEPDRFPMEIAVETADTETEAGKLEQTWQKRGYKAFYERIIEAGEAKYQIKLWGYRSREDAERDIQTIEAKYKGIHCEIE